MLLPDALLVAGWTGEGNTSGAAGDVVTAVVPSEVGEVEWRKGLAAGFGGRGAAAEPVDWLASNGKGKVALPAAPVLAGGVAVAGISAPTSTGGKMRAGAELLENCTPKSIQLIPALVSVCRAMSCWPSTAVRRMSRGGAGMPLNSQTAP